MHESYSAIMELSVHTARYFYLTWNPVSSLDPVGCQGFETSEKELISIFNYLKVKAPEN